MWAAILLVVFRLVRRDGIECLVGVLEWSLGFCELFLFIRVDLMLSSDMTYVLICLLRADRRRMDIKKEAVVKIRGCVYKSFNSDAAISMRPLDCEDVMNETPTCARCMDKIGQQQIELGQPSHTELPSRSNYSPFVRSPSFHSTLDIDHTYVYCTVNE